MIKWIKKRGMLYFKQVLEQNLKYGKTIINYSSSLMRILFFGGALFLFIYLICHYDAEGQPDIMVLLLSLYALSLYILGQIWWYIKTSLIEYIHHCFYQKYYKQHGKVSEIELIKIIEKELSIKVYEDEKEHLNKMINKPKIVIQKKTFKI